jgi:DNA-binding transcriptional ArsR family regulator
MVFIGSVPNGMKITIDQKTFKVLASETRIGILKKLDKSQMTVSDLARVLGMSKATLFEHLEKLIKIGLIKKIEDNRKWVYYRLTWKGKNILHPERTKIAIVLSFIIVMSVILGYLVILNSGVNIFYLPPRDQDSIAPTIEFSEVDDINENTNEPIEIIINVYDNKGLDQSSLSIEYTISNNYQEKIELLGGWQELDGTINEDRINLMLPLTNWDQYANKYLYIRCSVKDKAGNLAEEVYIEYIERIFEDSFDLSVMISDIGFEVKPNALQIKGIQTIPLAIKVHNAGAFEVQDVELSVFSRDPDTDEDGIVDDFEPLMATRNIDSIESGNLKIVELEIELNLSRSKRFWISVDPNNVYNESNEFNNLVNVNLGSDSPSSIIPEFPTYMGLIVAIIVILIFGNFRKRSR